jgi:two-component system sensor kinase FixL
MIEEATVFAMSGQDRQHVSARFDFDPSVPVAVVDRVQIQQVVANLVRNAVEAMRQSGTRELVVSTRAKPEGLIEVGVADTGPGVAENMRETLFEPFKSTKPGGMGLGLSICRSIVEAHGGRIGHAQREGGGSLFGFTLDIMPRDDAPA